MCCYGNSDLARGNSVLQGSRSQPQTSVSFCLTQDGINPSIFRFNSGMIKIIILTDADLKSKGFGSGSEIRHFLHSDVPQCNSRMGPAACGLVNGVWICSARLCFFQVLIPNYCGSASSPTCSQPLSYLLRTILRAISEATASSVKSKVLK